MNPPSNAVTAQGGADAGMGAWKLWLKVTDAGVAPDQPTRTETIHVEFLSQVAIDGLEQSATTLGLRASKPPLRIEVGGRTYFVGARSHDFGRPIEALDYERLTGAPEMIALFYGALTRLSEQLAVKGIALETLSLLFAVGLPYGSVKGEGGEKIKAAVRRWMEGDHTWLADKQPHRAHVAAVKVATQATGALFDYLLTDEGKFDPARKKAFKGEVGVVSVGFNTVELQVVRNKEEVSRFTGGQTVGVRRLLELANPGNHYSLGELDTLLRAGQLDVTSTLPVWEREVIGFIESRWGETWKRFEMVLLVGGGAQLLSKSLPYRFNGKASIPDQPVLSIARGLTKLTQLTSAKARKQTDGNAESAAEE